MLSGGTKHHRKSNQAHKRATGRKNVREERQQCFAKKLWANLWRVKKRYWQEKLKTWSNPQTQNLINPTSNPIIFTHSCQNYNANIQNSLQFVKLKQLGAAIFRNGLKIDPVKGLSPHQLLVGPVYYKNIY